MSLKKPNGCFVRPDLKRIIVTLSFFLFAGLLAGSEGVYAMMLPGILTAAWVFGVGVDINPEYPGWYKYPVFFSLLLLNLLLWYALACIVVCLLEKIHNISRRTKGDL